MSDRKHQLAIEAAQLAKVIELFEGQMADFKQKYWAKVCEIHSLEKDLGRCPTMTEFAVRAPNPEDILSDSQGRAVTNDGT